MGAEIEQKMGDIFKEEPPVSAETRRKHRKTFRNLYLIFDNAMGFQEIYNIKEECLH